ncbi:MAG: hypothetical protein JW764_08835 [Chlorobiaceae bacterium]|nr:hypothetical protein [Chlorobiaceae bacterium]
MQPKQNKAARKTKHLVFPLLLLSLMQAPEAGYALSGQKATTLDEADKAFKAMQYSAADSLYNCLVPVAPESSDLYWKLARLNISIAEAIPPNERQQRMPFYAKAVEYGRKAVQLDENNANAHTWLAAALALKADKIGAKEKLARAAEIKRELDKALALNPNDDVAWSMLGSYNYQASQIGWFSRFMGSTFVGKMPKGNLEEAEKNFKKAISLNPRVIRHYHELAKVYLAKDRKKDALDILLAAENKPVLMKSDIRRLEEIRKLIAKLKKEVGEH